MPRQVALYSKEGCHLCDDVRVMLEEFRTEFDLHVREIDITTNPELHERYRNIIPVVVIDGERTLASRISRERLRKALSG